MGTQLAARYWVIDDQHNLTAIDAARVVDLGNAQQRFLELGFFDSSRHARLGEQDIHTPGLAGQCHGRRPSGWRGNAGMQTSDFIFPGHIPGFDRSG